MSWQWVKTNLCPCISQPEEGRQEKGIATNCDGFHDRAALSYVGAENGEQLSFPVSENKLDFLSARSWASLSSFSPTATPEPAAEARSMEGAIVVSDHLLGRLLL